jgi:hypothetical protein
MDNVLNPHCIFHSLQVPRSPSIQNVVKQHFDSKSNEMVELCYINAGTYHILSRQMGKTAVHIAN